MKPHLLAAAAALLLATSTAEASGLKALEARHINLGAVAGVAYYTVQPDGYHVVATLGTPGANAMPVRVQAVLAAGQGLTFSTPGDAAAGPATVRIDRFGDDVVVRSGALTD